MDILIISCTQKKATDDDPQILKSSTGPNCFITTVWENKESLSKVYNSYLTKEFADEYDCVLFVHDDVLINCANLAEQLEEAFKQFDIVGLAGGIDPKIQHPALWHIMCERQNHRGFVAHPCNQTQLMVTSFGPSPSRVVILDGLFLAVNLKPALEKQWKFNENYSFHHYDISSCIDAHRKGLKLGVWPIYAVHTSPGLLSIEDKMWAESNKKFLEEYGKV